MQGDTLSIQAKGDVSKNIINSRARWAGIGIEDAFNPQLEYCQRLTAQKAFNQAVRKAQKRVLAGLTLNGQKTVLKVKPQVSPCYTNYPAGPAAWAAVGLSAYLEFKAYANPRFMNLLNDKSLNELERKCHIPLDRPNLRQVAQNVFSAVENRLVLADLHRSFKLQVIEIYRMFEASQQELRLASLPEITNAVVLFGDVLPPWDDHKGHYLAIRIARALSMASKPYLDLIQNINMLLNRSFAWIWGLDLMKALAPFLPQPDSQPGGVNQPGQTGAAPGRAAPENGGGPDGGNSPDAWPDACQPYTQPETDYIPPLDGPQLPTLGKDPNPLGIALSTMSEKQDGDGSKAHSQAREAVAQLIQTARKAGQQTESWQDMRSDLVAEALRHRPFSPGPMEGELTQGHHVEYSGAGGEKASGEIFERPIEYAQDQEAAAKLMDEARPLADKLRRLLYPDQSKEAQSRRLCTSGQLDPARLPIASVVPASFKRIGLRNRNEQNARPVFVLACDGSGSLRQKEMHILKLLAAAWLSATSKSRIRLMAGLYHSGQVRRGVSGSLVQWLYHPNKTPAWSVSEAIEALAALPARGSGVQADALSLAFMIKQALALAKGDSIYLTVLSDTKWNSSQGRPEQAGREVSQMLEDFKKSLGPRLNALLVALGTDGNDSTSKSWDQVLGMSAKILESPGEVAELISNYVLAPCGLRGGCSEYDYAGRGAGGNRQ
jgi:hypothetical protein